ncbi:MAG TPA: caspase family protein [Blastocatellia bacterium]|nr:caspase family protein [Blastocatellia bacterium]
MLAQRARRNAPPAATPNTPRLVVQTGHTRDTIDSITFSADGRYVITGSWSEGTAIVWDVTTGREIRRFGGNTDDKGYQDGKISGAFSPDYRTIAVSSEGSIRIWDLATGKMLRRLRGLKLFAAPAFTPDGKSIVVGGGVQKWDLATGALTNGRETQGERPETDAGLSADGKLKVVQEESKKEFDQPHDAVVIDVASGKEIRRLKGHERTIGALALSPDGRIAVTAGDDQTIRVWDVATGAELRQLTSFASQAAGTVFTADGLFTVMSDGENIRLREVATGKESVLPDADTEPAAAVAFSSDRKFVAAAVGMKTRVIEVATGKVVAKLESSSEEDDKGVLRMEFSSDGRFLLTDCSWTSQLWDLRTGTVARQLRKSKTIISAYTFSADGRYAAYDQEDESGNVSNMVIRELATGRERKWRVIPKYPNANFVESIAFSPDNKVVATAINNVSSRSGTLVQLWDRATGREVRRLLGHALAVRSVAFSPDGKLIATGSTDATARLWDAATGKELLRLKGHSDPVEKVSFSPDSRFVLTGSENGTLRLCSAATGDVICQMVTFDSGDWVNVTPDGQFDTSNLENIQGLHWVVPDEPLQALPLEIFMRSYYEPRLLARLLAGEKLPPAPKISEQNRIQPQVRIAEIKPQATSPNADTISVTVEVANLSGKIVRDGQQITMDSGVWNLRLFRDGQLVGCAPEQDGAIRLDASGKAVLTFDNIRLPRRADLKQVEFSAYAFNADRIKSETARQTYVLPAPLETVKGRAYVITVGVNAYENSSFDLRFAANDARRLQSVMADRLKSSGEYDEVIPVTLLSDYELRNGQRTVTLRQATKGNVRLVLDALAGRQVDEARLKAIPNAERLRPARPEDVVIISFASHGYADRGGNFYLVTYDSGAGTKREVTPEVLQRSISSDELSLWLRGVDAGELALVVDACQSAASVEGADFKPGPMGSRGLGQLSYDKGMRILTATQADNVALENRAVQHGLMTYALVHDGIELARADFKPADRVVTMAEWLTYAVERVPKLFAEVRRGGARKLEPGDETRILILSESGGAMIQGKPAAKGGKSAEGQIQQPSLFDFSRRKRDAVLMKK